MNTLNYFLLVLARSWDALWHPQFYPTRGRRKLLDYILQSISFRWQLFAAKRIDFPDRPRLTVILTSFKREANIPFILESVLSLPYVTEVILTNNNPGRKIDLRRFANDPRLLVYNQKQPTACGYRYDLALRSGGERFIVIDDDIFLSPQQIDLLYSQFLENPSKLHGVQGQNWNGGTESSLPFPVVGESEVDVLNRIYVLDRSSLETMYRVLAKFGIKDSSKIHNAEDIFVSFSGTAKPQIHAIGKWVDCPTGYKNDTAIYLNRPHFQQERNLIFNQLKLLQDDPEAKLVGAKEVIKVIEAVNHSSFD